MSDADNLGAQHHCRERYRRASWSRRSGYSIGIAFPPSWDEGYILSLKQGDSHGARRGHDVSPHTVAVGRRRRQDRGISDTIRITGDGCESFFTTRPGLPRSSPEAGRRTRRGEPSAAGDECSVECRTRHRRRRTAGSWHVE
ncbi:MAG: hypothetical protein U5K76_01270 [Woeseiaceae bacterium]|nr:hypothetical protein [Woeseiaceae bacterium]